MISLDIQQPKLDAANRYVRSLSVIRAALHWTTSKSQIICIFFNIHGSNVNKTSLILVSDVFLTRTLLHTRTIGIDYKGPCEPKGRRSRDEDGWVGGCILLWRQWLVSLPRPIPAYTFGLDLWSSTLCNQLAPWLVGQPAHQLSQQLGDYNSQAPHCLSKCSICHFTFVLLLSV